MKKFLSIFLSLSVISTFVIQAASYDSYSQASNQKDYIQKIESDIVDFYRYKDIGTNNMKAQNFSTDIYMFLNKKAETEIYVTDLYGIYKENYSVNPILLSETRAPNNKTTLIFQVITNFNYIGIDAETTVSEEVCIVYDIIKNDVVDMFSPLHYYDMATRADNLSKEKAVEKDFVATRQFLDKHELLINSINSVYSFENQDTSIDEAITTHETGQLRTSSLNRQATVNWARANYNKGTPSSGNGTIPYYDFSEISGSWDCTNFVSHALLAGVAKVNDTGGSGIGSTGWYYRNMSNRSSSWSGVNKLHEYMSSATTANKATAKGQIFQYTNNGGFWAIGSVIQFNDDFSNDYNHSAIITIEQTSSDGTRSYAYVTGRTSDTSYNNNQAASAIYPNGAKRVMNVYNY